MAFLRALSRGPGAGVSPGPGPRRSLTQPVRRAGAGYGVEILFTVLDKPVNDLKSYIGGKDDAGNAPKPK